MSPAIVAAFTVWSFKNNALKVCFLISTGSWYPMFRSWAMIPGIGLFCLNGNVPVDEFFMVILIVLSSSMAYNPSGICGNGANPDVSIICVPGLYTIVGLSVIIWTWMVFWSMYRMSTSSVGWTENVAVSDFAGSWLSKSLDTSEANASHTIGFWHRLTGKYLSGKKIALFDFTSIIAPFLLRKSVPIINSDDRLSVMWILMLVLTNGCGIGSLISIIAS